jgi:protocatechuate 3,4-dioxygenase beta subunit
MNMRSSKTMIDGPNRISRREILKAGAGVAAGTVAGSALGGSPGPTPGNPEGPFYPVHEQADRDMDLTRIRGSEVRAEGTVIRIEGRVLDGNGDPIEGALVDIWQANTHGRYHHEGDPNPAPRDPGFQGWGMMRTDAQGRYGFTTIKPGAYPVNENWWRPPHIHYKVSRRGYRELTTQMYFAGDPLNASDALLNEVPEAERGRLLVSLDEGEAVPTGRFDIVLTAVQQA